MHMQRWILGDDIFFSALRNYFTDEKVANGFAYSEDWIRHIETAGDTSLTEFFNDWLYKEGYPIYSINYTQYTSDSANIQLNQTTSHESVDFFEMPVPIRLYNKNRSDSADFRLDNRVNNQEFIVKPGFMVEEIVIDPEDWILCKTGTITSAPATEAKTELIVFPNPTNGTLSISLPHNQTIQHIQIFSAKGNLITELEQNTDIINFSMLPSGIYFLQVKTEKNIFKSKVIKN